MRERLILRLFDELKKGNKISREKFCSENAISERTFYRYMSAIRDYLITEQRGCVIVYDKEDESYFMEEV